MDLPFALLAATSESLKIPLAMLLVLGAARFLDEVFERLNQPGLVGQIVAGIVIGPGVLHSSCDGELKPWSAHSRLSAEG